MQPWHRKAAIDALKAVVPFNAALRHLKRRIRPHQTNPENDVHLVGDAARLIRHLHDLGISVAGKRVVEIGTGWNPVMALMLSNCGALSITTIDIERLLDARLLRYASSLIGELAAKIRELLAEASSNWSVPTGVADESSTLTELLAARRIEYKAPFDFRRLPDECADIIVSRDVLEHVPEGILAGIFQASTRVLRPSGVVCHTIDMSDHWEHVDKSIPRVNFLQYESGRLWDIVGINPQNYQNRLRRFEYIAMIERAGFEVVFANGTPDTPSLEALPGLKVCKRYEAVPRDELAVLSTTIIARRS